MEATKTVRRNADNEMDAPGAAQVRRFLRAHLPLSLSLLLSISMRAVWHRLFEHQFRTSAPSTRIARRLTIQHFLEDLAARFTSRTASGATTAIGTAVTMDLLSPRMSPLALPTSTLAVASPRVQRVLSPDGGANPSGVAVASSSHSASPPPSSLADLLNWLSFLGADLTSFQLRNPRLEPHLGELLACMTNLRWLDLAASGYEKQIGAILARGLRSHAHTLTGLDLARCGIGADGIRALTQMMTDHRAASQRRKRTEVGRTITRTADKTHTATAATTTAAAAAAAAAAVRTSRRHGFPEVTQRSDASAAALPPTIPSIPPLALPSIRPRDADLNDGAASMRTTARVRTTSSTPPLHSARTLHLQQANTYTAVPALPAAHSASSLASASSRHAHDSNGGDSRSRTDLGRLFAHARSNAAMRNDASTAAGVDRAQTQSARSHRRPQRHPASRATVHVASSASSSLASTRLITDSPQIQARRVVESLPHAQTTSRSNEDSMAASELLTGLEISLRENRLGDACIAQFAQSMHTSQFPDTASRLASLAWHHLSHLLFVSCRLLVQAVFARSMFPATTSARKERAYWSVAARRRRSRGSLPDTGCMSRVPHVALSDACWFSP